MDDTVRSQDPNHLIFTSTQYVAELVDWPYRQDRVPVPSLVPTYQSLHQRLLQDCGSFCWNVLGLTAYDFNPYDLDDAMLAHQHGVASVMTEYGFTRGTPSQMQTGFGGDRAAAVRSGLDRPWTLLDGTVQPHLASAQQLVQQGVVNGLAPWGSPAPGPQASLDEDSQRGITGTPDEAALWSAWADTGAALERANKAAGPSSICLAFTSVSSS
jgi:hypothetical protein